MGQRVGKAYILARDGFLAALLFAGQVALSSAPNVEIVTPLIFTYALFLGKHAVLIVQAYILLAALLWGPGLWVLGYVIAWNFLVLATCLGKKLWDGILIPLFLGFFGAVFGTLCAIPYFFIDIHTGISYIIQGALYDMIHACSNIIMGIFLVPVFSSLLERMILWERQLIPKNSAIVKKD